MPAAVLHFTTQVLNTKYPYNTVLYSKDFSNKQIIMAMYSTLTAFIPTTLMKIITFVAGEKVLSTEFLFGAKDVRMVSDHEYR